ncbi:MAG: tyrosine-protein phosphatase, partial [Anaerolineales bacterium]|nr:tyrosine-protein phosphatase [Anaerolineales bacterium]
LHLPLAGQAGRRAQAAALRRYRRQMDGLLQQIYTRELIDENAAGLGALLRLLAEPANRPALIHCAVGKDRTGVAAALLLALLGVPDDVIVAEYSLSNRAHAEMAALMRPAFRRAWWAGVRPSRLEPLLLARPQTMRAALAHLRQRYGSVAAYVREAAGVGDEVVAGLREGLLEATTN